MIPLPPTQVRGQQLVAGLGHATVVPDLDFETYSEAGYVIDPEDGKLSALPGASGGKKGLRIVGLGVYARHPSTEILSLKYDLKDGHGARHWRPGLPPPFDLFNYLATGGPIEAWNVSFERNIWAYVCVARLGWPKVDKSQWRCAMAKSRANALPGSLDEAGKVLNLRVQKDADGKRLLDKFSVPHKPSKKDPRRRIFPIPSQLDPMFDHVANTLGMKVALEDLADTLKLYGYNETDIVSEAEASGLSPDLDGEEFDYWQVDQDINDRGVQIDVETVDACIAVIEQAHEKYNTELEGITGIQKASQVKALTEWLAARGVFMDSMDEDSVENALKTFPLDAASRRVLEIRAAIGSASVKKTYALRNRTVNGRTYGLFNYHAAHTGRATGEGAQPTNMPKAGPDLRFCGVMKRGEYVPGSGCGKHFNPATYRCPWCGLANAPGKDLVEWNPRAAEDAIAILQAKSLPLVELFFGDAMHTIAGVIRGLYISAPGKDLVSSDFSAIEAVVLAVLANEKWRLEVFRTHGKIYEASAAMMYRTPFEDFKAYKDQYGQHHPLRAKGKIGELAFGYQGWIGAAKQFGMPGSDDEIKQDILKWRAASPSIEWLWGGQTLGKASGILFNYDGMGLPGVSKWDDTPHFFGVEGMAISAMSNPGTRFHVKCLDGTQSGISFLKHGDILYCRLPSGRDLKYRSPALRPSPRGGMVLSYWGWNTNPKNGPTGWIQKDTWGGRLVENIVQATSRDILRHSTINLERAGYSVVMHVYDEIVSEIFEGCGSVEDFERIMKIMPPWAFGWPIKADGGWRAKRYRKG